MSYLSVYVVSYNAQEYQKKQLSCENSIPVQQLSSDLFPIAVSETVGRVL